MTQPSIFLGNKSSCKNGGTDAAGVINKSYFSKNFSAFLYILVCSAIAQPISLMVIDEALSNSSTITLPNEPGFLLLISLKSFTKPIPLNK